STWSSRWRQTSASGWMKAELTTSTGISTSVANSKAIRRQRSRRIAETAKAPLCGASTRYAMPSACINSLVARPVHQPDGGGLQLAGLGDVDQVVLELAPARDQRVRLVGGVGRIFHVEIGEHALTLAGREPLQQ